MNIKETKIRNVAELEAKAKTAYKIHDLVQSNLHHTVDLKDYKWVSLNDVKELLGGRSQEPSSRQEVSSRKEKQKP